MFVSEVLRLIVARRVMGAKSYPGGGRAQQPPGPRRRGKYSGKKRARFEIFKESATLSDIIEDPLTKPGRSPVLGYNHNLRYGGRTFHVQTEDSGQGYARVYTHLFYEGTILSSKKEEYDPRGAGGCRPRGDAEAAQGDDQGADASGARRAHLRLLHRARRAGHVGESVGARGRGGRRAGAGGACAGRTDFADAADRAPNRWSSIRPRSGRPCRRPRPQRLRRHPRR